MADEAGLQWGDAFRSEEPAEEPEADQPGRYRERLDAAEADNERLRGLLDSMRAAEVDRLTAGRLADPRDLYRDGATIADLVDEEGRVDPARVDAAVTGLLKEHPHWKAPLPGYRGPLHSGATARGSLRPPKAFADAFAAKADHE